jgi:hypothetical protein
MYGIQTKAAPVMGSPEKKLLLKKQYKSVLYHWTTETTTANVSRSRIWRENTRWGKILEKLFRKNDRQSILDLYIIKKILPKSYTRKQILAKLLNHPLLSMAITYGRYQN